MYRTAGPSVTYVAYVVNPHGGTRKRKIRGGEGRGVRAVSVDQNAELVLLHGAYFWFRDQDLSSQRMDMPLQTFM